MVHLDYRDARPIYTQIVDGFREQIVAGILQPGEKLPSVRELAGELTINPNTIQRAYRELEISGWVASVPGKGSFVCGVPAGSRREQLRLLEEFDKVSAALAELGISREELAARLQQGGKEHD
jgi:GntR family transcriptional regulator